MRIQVLGVFASGSVAPLPAPIGLTVERQPITIGRSPRGTPALVILASSVSKEHARVELGDQGWTLTDLYSDNGIYSYPGLQRVQSLTIREETQVLIGEFVVLLRPSVSDG